MQQKRAGPLSVRWEYKIVKMRADLWTDTGLPDDINLKFDEYGAEGWELVGTDTIQRATVIPMGGSKTVTLVAYFKRRVRT